MKGYRSFIQKQIKKGWSIPRVSDTRFVWRDIAALFVWKVFFFLKKKKFVKKLIFFLFSFNFYCLFV